MNREIKSLPMVALRGMTIMPEMVVHFDVSREKSIAAIQEAMAGKVTPEEALANMEQEFNDEMAKVEN